jgi:hypothetical protein
MLPLCGMFTIYLRRLDFIRLVELSDSCCEQTNAVCEVREKKEVAKEAMKDAHLSDTSAHTASEQESRVSIKRDYNLITFIIYSLVRSASLSKCAKGAQAAAE